MRRATVEDVPWLLAELREFAAHYPISNVSLFGSDTHAEGLLLALIVGQYVAIAHRGDERLGLIAGGLAPHPYNPDLIVASELWWWVTPEHRGTRAGYALLAAFHRWARDAGADLVTMTLASNSQVRPDALERMGYRETERAYTFAFAPVMVGA